MFLIPRWEVMIDDAKAMAKRIVLSAFVLLLSRWVIRAVIPWLIFALLVIEVVVEKQLKRIE